MTDQMTLADFIAKHQIRMTSVHTDRNPHMADDDWSRTATHWKCIIGRGKARMTVPFSQGSAHTEAPTLATVLDCLASDASSVENARDFREWAEEMGGDPDSIKALKTYRLIQKQAAKLEALLGPDAYAELLWECERL
jgi:hypothetical protein